MWVDKDIIPMLIEAVKLAARDSLEDWVGDDGGDDYDPNDLIIFHSFVLPVLEDSRGQGFDSGDMLYKGFGFMVVLIPWYLNQRGNTLSKACFGKLALLYYHYQLQGVVSALEHRPLECIWENLSYLNQDIEGVKLIINPDMYPIR